jgi:hypothetical protein
VTRVHALAAVLIWPLFFAHGARAEDLQTIMFFNGNDLLQACESTDRDRRMICLGYAAAVSDGASMARTMKQDVFKPICIPMAADTKQMQDIIVKYLIAHPQVRHAAAVSLGLAALLEAFPCP